MSRPSALSSPYLQRRGAAYYFRFTIPPSLVASLGIVAHQSRVFTDLPALISGPPLSPDQLPLIRVTAGAEQFARAAARARGGARRTRGAA